MSCYVNFEGADGSGKTTVLEKIKELMPDIIVTKEPQGIFREMVLDPQNKTGLTEIARMFLYQADRAIHTETFVKPNLEKGKIVISDRGPLSTFVYQSITTKIPFQDLYDVTRIANQSIWPDLFILFDIRSEVGKERMSNRELDFFESKGKDFFDQLVNHYRFTGQQLIDDFGLDVRFVNAEKPLDLVVKDVLEIIKRKINPEFV